MSFTKIYDQIVVISTLFRSEITYNNEQTTVYSEAPNAEMTPSPSNGSLFEGAMDMEMAATQLPPSYDSLGQCESPYDYGFVLSSNV